MSKSKNPKNQPLASWECDQNTSSKWSKISIDLMTSPAFTKLTMAARLFYIAILVNKHDTNQSQCLYNALRDYYNMIGEDVTDEDLKYLCGDYDHCRKTSTKFVFPEKQFEAYGFKAPYVSKIKKELIAAGFIKVFANKKAKGRVDLNVTIYELSDAWKRRK